ncbi:MAG: hypothetical protein JXR59_08800 [Desulfuromonadaceae bacterium]|nr:hypothetical protein [Desulfuromonadaceae bacterium]
MARINFFAIILTLLMVACPLWAADDMMEVISEGCGRNLDSALLDAKRLAIEQGIGSVLVSQTEVENYMLKKDVVLSKTQGAVRRYEQLGTRHEGDSLCVSIRAQVSLADIRDDLLALRILLESMERPRMMVLIEQENGGKAAENEIIDYLNSKEFNVVDPAMVATLQAKEADEVRQAVAGDPVAAARLGADNGAEYILVGQVKRGLQKNDLLAGSGMQSAQAQISARVVNCSNSRVVASKTVQSSMAHLSEDAALQGAVLKTAQKLMDAQLFEAIVTSFQNQVNNGQTFEVTVKNLASFADQKKAQDVLSKLDGIRSLSKRSFSGGEMALSITFLGSPDSFCEAADGKAIGDRRLAVTEVVGNRIVLSLQ